MFADYEVPVAYSMVRLAKQLEKSTPHPVHLLTCYWVAFNNVYVTIADRSGVRPALNVRKDGTLRTEVIGTVTLPKVNRVTERTQLDLAYGQFSETLKRTLVEHPSTLFFAKRIPRWRGNPLPVDGNGQRLNGVLSVGNTVDAMNPVWAPIDVQMFKDYHSGATDATRLDPLARQVLNLVYTVRNNTVHGAKSSDDANDVEVLERALPLLVMIVASFVAA